MKFRIAGLLAVSALSLSGCTVSLGVPDSQTERDTSSQTEAPSNNSGSDNNSDTISGASGSEFMAMALEDLNTYDINGSWFEDPYPDASGLSVGVLLDDYSVAPEGCALWWYESEADLNAHVDSNIDFFNSFYFESWVYDAGPAVLLAASRPLDICYISAIIILELEP
jgi:hypothetical protein